MSKVFKNKIVYILIFLSMMFAVASGVSAVEENSIQWMEYTYFLDQESDIAWEHPEVYVGCQANFDSITYSKFLIGNLVDGKLVQYGEVALQENSENLRNIGNDYIVTIVDYYFDESTNSLWYKVEAAEGYTLPQAFVDNPYVRYAWSYTVDGWPPAVTLQMIPKKAMFRYDTLTVTKTTEAASQNIVVNKADAPAFFDVTYVSVTDAAFPWYGYTVDVTTWNENYGSEFKYVEQNSVILIPVAVTASYEKLLEAEGSREYNEILESIPEDILDMFSPAHKENIDKQYDELVRLENIEYKTTTTINGVSVPVSVKGKIPETGVKLSVTPVDNETVVKEGFEIKDMSDLVTSLDIKILNTSDDSEWQPDEGNQVAVSIDMASLGYKDGRIFQLHHKHGNRIDKYEIFIVIDGKLTLYTNGFSIFTVLEPEGVENATRVANNGAALSLEVGEEAVYYFTRNDDGTVNDNDPGSPSKWAVKDTAGAIHYTVHAEGGNSNQGVKAPWIKIVALKSTCKSIAANGTPVSNTPVELTGQWRRYNTNYSFTSELTITPPKAKANENNGKKLYLKDTVNTTGTITATLVDTNGNEIPNGLEGASFSWTRDDGMFITPRAYSNNYRSVNIAVDHAGLVEARKKDGVYNYVTYTVNAILADTTEVSATYTVYYQSEVINSNFEIPRGTPSGYTFFVNGTPNLYWKTTAPGDNGNLTRDIEIANMTDFEINGTEFGVDRSADWNNEKDKGVQFAELNAEDFGALYQDIITAPGEKIEWEFAHAPRRDIRNANWADEISNAMYIVIGPTEEAQKLTDSTQLQALGNIAKTESTKLSEEQLKEFNAGRLSVSVKYDGIEYSVWYHDAGSYEPNDNSPYTEAKNYGWTQIYGSYLVPDNQYRTRLFFVSEPSTNKNSLNAGNLIDAATVGQYKTYLIEYYEETFRNGEKVLEYKTSYVDVNGKVTNYTEDGKALVYSSVPLKNLDQLIKKENDYLYKILINGENCPYDIRYDGDASIYIQSYPGTPSHPKNAVYPLGYDTNYKDYQIVVQIFVRDTVIAIQKDLTLPDAMTVQQKLNLVTGLPNGYQMFPDIYSMNGSNKEYLDIGDTHITIKSPDPNGNYTGYVSPNDNPDLNKTYFVKERSTTLLPGLKLHQVKFKVTRYKYGVGDEPATEEYTVDVDGFNDEIVSDGIYLSEDGYKIAEVEIDNIYVEKETVIKYKAIGNGKVALIGSTNFSDIPTETLAFYSGKAIGAAVHPGDGAVFVGWYKDEACTKPVQPVDGVWDEETNTFKPNANILNQEEVTFYAKFASGSITIERENAKEGDTFIYYVEGTNGLKTYVSLTCGADGKGKVDILEVGPATYTVTELTDHSWRYDNPSNPHQTKQLTYSIGSTEDDLNIHFKFDGAYNRKYWVNGYGDVKKNVRKEGS